MDTKIFLPFSHSSELLSSFPTCAINLYQNKKKLMVTLQSLPTACFSCNDVTCLNNVMNTTQRDILPLPLPLLLIIIITIVFKFNKY